MYHNLDPARIVATVALLRDRIRERFPESSLGRLAEDFVGVAAVAGPESEWLARPNQWLRGLNVALILLFLAVLGSILIIIGKVAAVYVQKYDDPVVLSGVDQVEDLTTGLSRKVWQKIMIIDRAQD